MSKDFLQYILEDLLGEVSEISSRKMFGGVGLYKNGIICGMIIDDTLYFKVDESNKPQYQKHNSKPFSYSHHGKTVAMSYWEVPADIMDDKDTLQEWLEVSYQISKNRRTKK